MHERTQRKTIQLAEPKRCISDIRYIARYFCIGIDLAHHKCIFYRIDLAGFLCITDCHIVTS